MPIISVVIPVYRVEDYLHRCIDSILRQTFADFELILIDDGSPDNCGTICDEYAQKDSRIRVIHQENGGLSAARNAGIDWIFANSDSQWLTFIDSDDWIHPDYLITLFNAATSFNLPLSICGFIRTSGELPSIPLEQFVPKMWASEDFFVEHNINAIIACGKLYRKDLFQNIRFPIGKIHEDEFTTYKFLFSTNTVAVVDAPLYFYYVNESGITGSSCTPKRLHLLEAMDERLVFFKNKYHKTYPYQLQLYARSIWFVKSQLDEAGYTLSWSQNHALKKSLKKTLRCCRKYGLLPFTKYYHLYELAHPWFMRIYWLSKVIKSKLHR